MTLIYTGLIVNFLCLVTSWVLFFKFFRKKDSDVDLHLKIEEIREDLRLVTKNPAAARRKLNSDS